MKEVYRSNWFNLLGYLACTVKYNDGSKKTVLQHRELMEEHLGRKLDSIELIHHKDGDKRNNIIANLELTNKKKHINIHRKKTEWVTIQCILCKRPFKVEARVARWRKRRQKAGPFCGKSCVGKWVRQNQLDVGRFNLRSK